MILCSNHDCGRRVSARVAVCPACGRTVNRPERVGRYALLECVAESRTASIYRARRDGEAERVCLRLYNTDVGLSADETDRLRQTFAALDALPEDRFVHTLDFGQTETGIWYRVTPWLPNVMAWGDLKSRELHGGAVGKRRWLGLFLNLAESLGALHRQGRIIPDMTLDDCLLYRADDGTLRIRLDATLASCLGLGSGREKVRTTHPDFAPGNTLSEQSDVWTLGSLMVSMLLGTTQIADYAATMDTVHAERRPVALPPALGRLLRQMVDPDPAERPRGMQSVCEALRAFGPSEISEWCALERDPWHRSRLARRIGIAVAAAALAVMALGVGLHQRQQRRMDAEVGSLRAMDPEARTEAVLARYSRSVAFVLSECWLEVNGVRKTYTTSNQVAVTSGTAFLVTEDGYLLTNRHVLQPWSRVASELNERIEELRASGEAFRVGVNYWLWFDGDEAFRPGSAAWGAEQFLVEDYYRLENAYSNAGGDLRVSVAGVKPLPADPAEYVNSTLDDDVAVLKINVVPEGAVPIPLSTAPPPERGAGVLILGYSHGRASISGTKALVRVVRGAVSRVFFDAIATDASTHGGNSGGPALDLDGRVIGVLTGGYMLDGMFQSGMGRLLPVAVAGEFLGAVRAGVPAWDGLPSAAFEPELRAAKRAADADDWEAARRLASFPGVLANPEVALFAAVYALDKGGFTIEGRTALEHVVTMTPDNPIPALLLYWDAWQRGVPVGQRPGRDHFMQAPWHSMFDLYSPVVRLIENEVPLEQALAEADFPLEAGLLLWAAGSADALNGEKDLAAKHIRRAMLFVDENDLLTRHLLTATLAHLCGEAHNTKPATGAEAAVDNDRARFGHLEKAFSATQNGDWNEALTAANAYFETPRREHANSLGMELLRCQLLGLAGDVDAERMALEAFRASIQNPWYASLADCLLGNRDAAELLRAIEGHRPEVVTLAVAMGLRAERDKDTPLAIRWYSIALDTSQHHWLEFQLAQERRKALRGRDGGGRSTAGAVNPLGCWCGADGAVDRSRRVPPLPLAMAGKSRLLYFERTKYTNQE